MVNVPTVLNKLNTKVDELDVAKLKTIPIDLKKITIKEIVKKHRFQHSKFKSKLFRKENWNLI